MASLSRKPARLLKKLSFSKYYLSQGASVTTFLARNCHQNVENEKSHDVIIVGGGLIGTALACALGRNIYFQDKKILLLELGKKFDYRPTEKYSNRVIAVNQKSRELLERIGAWKHVQEVRFCPVQKMQIWDASSDAAISFDNDGTYPALTYIVENDLIIHAITTELRKLENVTVTHNANVCDIKLSREGTEKVNLTLADGTKHRAQLVVGADGANSMVRSAMNVQCIRKDYGEMGIVATLKISEPPECNDVAWQRFLPTGPIAFLPLTTSLSSLVWTVPKQEAKVLMNISEEEFVDRVNAAVWDVYPRSDLVDSSIRLSNSLLDKLGLSSGAVRQLPSSVAAIEEGSRAAFPLGQIYTPTYCVSGAALIGDAVHKVHPLAGQGANLGFGDVAKLEQVLSNAAKYAFPLGDMNILGSFESTRLQNTVPLMLSIDMLHNLYATTMTPIVALRAAGLQIANSCLPLKRFFIRRAHGEDVF